MNFMHGFLVASLFWVSAFAYASFEGHLTKSHFAIVSELKQNNQQEANSVPLYDARGHEVP